MGPYIVYWMINGLTLLGVVVLFFLVKLKYWKSALLIGLFFLCAVWMRFVEPYSIAIEHKIIDVWVWEKIALIADLHLGVYKWEGYLGRVVKKINNLDVDRVLIAWDFLNDPLPWQTLEGLFAPLWLIQKPWYTVMGNHDTGAPGEDFEQELSLLLEKLGGEVIDNTVMDFDTWTLVWLWSHMAHRDDMTMVDTLKSELPVIVLAHNPDSTLRYTTNTVDLTLVGHTHCGQVRLPWVYQKYRRMIVPTVGDFDCGWSQEEYTQLFITPGLGEVILPVRLFNPVTISVLDL